MSLIDMTAAKFPEDIPCRWARCRNPSRGAPFKWLWTWRWIYHDAKRSFFAIVFFMLKNPALNIMPEQSGEFVNTCEAQMNNLTSRERLHRLYFHQEMDRPAAIVRWWGFRDDSSYADLFRLMTERADWVEPWDATSLVHGPEIPWAPKPENASCRHYLLRNAEDAERYLALPVPEIGGDVSDYLRLKKQVGERGIVLAHFGDNPGGQVAGLFGSEKFAVMTMDERELLHRLMRRQQEVTLRLLQHLIDHGVGPYFSICGQEMITPPLHGRDDFFDFNVRYDRPIADRIHEAGGRLNVHCHGRLKAVMDGFPAIGADVLHCFEAPPMGDVTPAEVKQAWHGRISLEGNIQIADFYEKTPDDISAQTEALIHACFKDRRGLAVTPTASPFMTGLGNKCYPQYLAMLDTVLGSASQ
jgi:hypothetical protein